MKTLPWVKELSRELFDLHTSPLLGSFPFSWEEFSQKVGHDLQIETLSVKPQTTGWDNKENILLSTGDHSQVLSFQVEPLSGELFWIMDQKEIAKLVNLFTAQKSHELGFSSEILQEGYYHYLVALTLDIITGHPLFSSFSITMRESNTLPETLLVREIGISYKGKSVYGKLALSPDMQKSWISHIQSHPPSPSIWADKVPIPLSLVLAELSLSPGEKEDWEVGSYLLLPSTDYETTTKKGFIKLFGKGIHLANLDLEGDKGLITKFEPKEATTMPENENISIEELPINLSVELARFSLPLNKILELEEGATLELPPIGEKVSILANGKKVASGELVYVGEQLAVRLEEVSK